jgi:dolichol-phosphate mannosyltransferase
MPKNLAVIVPTFRERENLSPLVDCLRPLLEGLDWEIIFVDDDSQDGSMEEFLRLNTEDPRVRFIRRVGRRGLASACLEGMCATGADVLAVMDADLQHDEAILPKMVAALREDPQVDLAVGTRYAGAGGVGEWSKSRHLLSRLGTMVEKAVLRTPLSDPMSGFFVIRRTAFEESVRNSTGKGFKILLDLVMSAPRKLEIREFAYVFRPRERGESKLDLLVGLEFLYLLAEKTFGGLVPVRFMVYTLVGLTGLALHLVILFVLHRALDWDFAASQWVATLAAMVSNFLINNNITYRSQRLRGASLLPGGALYIAICMVGAVTNVQVAQYLFGMGIPWWFSGIAGAGIGAVWNYAVSTQVVWTWFTTHFNRRQLRTKQVS